jgi:hypothetical protein
MRTSWQIQDVTGEKCSGLLQVGLGTDVAGGYSPSMLSAMRSAVVNSKVVRMLRINHARRALTPAPAQGFADGGLASAQSTGRRGQAMSKVQACRQDEQGGSADQRPGIEPALSQLASSSPAPIQQALSTSAGIRHDTFGAAAGMQDALEMSNALAPTMDPTASPDLQEHGARALVLNPDSDPAAESGPLQEDHAPTISQPGLGDVSDSACPLDGPGSLGADVREAAQQGPSSSHDEERTLDYKGAFWLATMGGAHALGLKVAAPSMSIVCCAWCL